MMLIICFIVWIKIICKKIEPNDKYRVEKAYSIYKQSGLTPSQYF